MAVRPVAPESDEYASVQTPGETLLVEPRSQRMRLPTRWIEIRLTPETSRPTPFLLATDDAGTRFRVELTERGRRPGRFLALLPHSVRSLELHTFRRHDHGSTGQLRVRQCGQIEIAVRAASVLARRILSSPSALRYLGPAGLRALRRRRTETIFARLLETEAPPPPGESYSDWIATYDTLSGSDREAIAERIRELRTRPLISVVMPVLDPSAAYLREAIDSLLSQLYERWELCVAGDVAPGSTTDEILTEYARRDHRIRVAVGESTGGLAAAANAALDMASGDFMALVDQDDVLAPHALYMIAHELERSPRTDLVYSDEDTIDADGKRSNPYFKPDWSPDLAHSQNYINRLAAYRLRIAREIDGFRADFEGSHEYDLLLRFTLRTSPERIRHVPQVLYHRRDLATSVVLGQSPRPHAVTLARRALSDHFAAQSIPARVESACIPHCHRVVFPLPAPPPRVSILVPTRDSAELLAACADGVLRETDYPDFELLILDNQSEKKETFELFERLTRDARVRILRYDAPFNYSAINNWGIARSQGEIITLLNNDTEVISAEWLREMVTHACRPEVGIVGARLLFASDRIQQAGVLLGPGGVATHLYAGRPRHSPGYFERAQLTQNLSAVTAACATARKSVLEEVGGFDESLEVAFNDVDLCLRIRDAGYRIVWTPYAELYHHESASIGKHDSPRRRELFQREMDTMIDRWGRALREDPFHNPNLSLEPGREFEPAFPPRVAKPWLAQRSSVSSQGGADSSGELADHR